MMTLMLLLSYAFAGEIVFDVRQPARILVGDHVAAELFEPAELRIPRDAGAVPIVVILGSDIHKLVVVVDEKQPSRVLIGKSGISVLSATPVAAPPAQSSANAAAQATSPAPADAAALHTTFRTHGTSQLMLVIDHARVYVGRGEDKQLALSVGDHWLEVRNADGTRLYAEGTLRVTGGGQALVQVSEGRFPEASGDTLSWLVGGG